MKLALRHAIACAAFASLPAFAADVSPKSPPAERKAQPATPETQQERMKRCNATAKSKELKGDERRAYMSTCLKG